MGKKEAILESLNAMCKNTLMETLIIKYIDLGEDYLVASMPVNSRVHQPDGILNGGATMALAESVGSPTSLLAIDMDKFSVRGIEFSANHLRSAKSGIITATGRIIHKGKTIHLVEIKVEDERGRVISICKLTNYILAK
ncbi:MAG: PaaI family thioesterase [Lutibacter sp.]|uniref:PaaI family thioesterase n=1 Tax=Lutibacter sp. TaxID=1925666 RepID=UPI00184211FF|nr:PaaI family thioesterase [Lutibacter sp.]MBT8316070.1 PaaI family thioesterase [Lutibacter sp.]NNJ56929.1 PaaI family thioesterase [Lutibacter sp.]